MMKTFFANPTTIEKKWYVVDARDLVLGRLATMIAVMLRGKHKPTYTPHMDGGDHIIVVNASLIHLTGRKRDRSEKTGKLYYRHTGYPGGIRCTTAGKMLEAGKSERLLRMAVTRMISRGPLQRQQLRHLYIYPGAEHPHGGQQPEPLLFAEKNPKNARR